VDAALPVLGFWEIMKEAADTDRRPVFVLTVRRGAEARNGYKDIPAAGIKILSEQTKFRSKLTKRPVGM
jgi:hypothetical protein